MPDASSSEEMLFLNRRLEVMHVEPEFDTTSLLAVRHSVLLSAVSLVRPSKPTVPVTDSVRHGLGGVDCHCLCCDAVDERADAQILVGFGAVMVAPRSAWLPLTLINAGLLPLMEIAGAPALVAVRIGGCSDLGDSS